MYDDHALASDVTQLQTLLETSGGTSVFVLTVVVEAADVVAFVGGRPPGSVVVSMSGGVELDGKDGIGYLLLVAVVNCPSVPV